MLNTSFVRGSAVLISLAASLGQSPAGRLQRPDAPDRLSSLAGASIPDPLRLPEGWQSQIR